MAKVQKVYTREFKEEAVRLAQASGKPITQVARELGISDTSIHQWRYDPGLSARRERFGDKAHRAKLAAQLSGSRTCLRLWLSRAAGQVSASWQSSASRRLSIETASRTLSSHSLRDTPGETPLRRLCPLP